MKSPFPRQSYRGPLLAVLFDWAGTIIDYGSRAPAGAFIAAFGQFGVEVTLAEAREPMGRAKRDHVATLLAMPTVAARWQTVHGRAACEPDIDAIYAAFQPLQQAVLAAHTDLIPGLLDTVAFLRQRGIKLGTTTGYSRMQTAVLLNAAREQGFVPDCSICAEDVPAGRPAPWMLWENIRQLQVYPTAAILTVDDTPVGIEAGRNAGTWTVGVTRSGNELGLSPAEIAALPPAEIASQIDQARQRLFAAGADYVIETVAELPEVVLEIEREQAAADR